MNRILSVVMMVGGLLLSPLNSVPGVAQQAQATAQDQAQPLRSVKAGNPYSDDVIRVAKALQQQYRDFYRLIAAWPRNVPEVMTMFQQYYQTYRTYWRAVAAYQQAEKDGLSFGGLVMGHHRLEIAICYDSSGAPIPPPTPEYQDSLTPLEGVQIVLTTEPKDPRTLPAMVARVSTDAKGRFRIPKLQEGTKYRYEMSSEGYEILNGAFTMGSTAIRRKFQLEARIPSQISGQVLALTPGSVPVARTVLEGPTTVDRKASDDIRRALGLPEVLTVQTVGADGMSLPPPQEELHVVAIYEGTVAPGTPRPAWPRSPRGEVAVEVQRTGSGAPMVLCLSAYDPCTWRLSVESEVTISKVILLGYHDQKVVGLPKGVPTERRIYDENSQDWFYIEHTEDSQNPPETDLRNGETDGISRLRDLTGLPVTSFQGTYTGSRFVVPEAQDEKVTPLAGARVMLIPAAIESDRGPGAPAPFTTETDASGWFSVLDIPPGEYTVRVEASGHLPFEDRVSTKSTEPLQILMVPSQLLPPPPDEVPVVSEAATASDDLNNPFEQSVQD